MRAAVDTDPRPPGGWWSDEQSGEDDVVALPVLLLPAWLHVSSSWACGSSCGEVVTPYQLKTNAGSNVTSSGGSIVERME